MLLGSISQDSLQNPKGVGPFCEIQDGTKAHFEVGCRAFWVGSDSNGCGETGNEIAGRREFREENHRAGKKFGQGKKKNTYLVMPDNHIKGTS